MPTRMQQRGVINSMKRPSPFANVGRQATTNSTSILNNNNNKNNNARPPISTTTKTTKNNKQHPLIFKKNSSNNNGRTHIKGPVPPVPSIRRNQNIPSNNNYNNNHNVSKPESTGGNQAAATHQLTEKIAILQEKGHIQKVEIDRQKLIINGLQRNLEHMTTSTKKDKQSIEQLNSKIYQLKKEKGQTNDLLYSPSSAKLMEQTHVNQIENLKTKFMKDYSALEHKYDINAKLLKEANHMNQMYNDRIKQFEKDLLSKSSTEVTFKKQMETVSAHAKRMVDENRKLKEQLKNSMNAKDEIVKLKSNVANLTDKCNNYVQEIEKLNYHNTEKNKKLEQYENEIEIMKETKENEIQRRKKAIKDLSSKSANLSQLKKEYEVSKATIKKLNDQLNNFEFEKKKEINSIQKEMKNVKDDLNWTIKEKNDLQDALNKIKQNYSILEISASKSSVKIPEMESRLHDMEKKYNNMKADRDLFAQQLEDLKRQQKKSVAGYEKEKNILKIENKLLKEKISSLETGKSSDKNDYEQEIERLKKLVENIKNEASNGIKKAQIQVDEIQNQCNLLLNQLNIQRNLVSSESERANNALQKLSAVEKERESEVQQIAFLERQLEDQRASSASESRRAESALEEASRCRDRYDNEHDRAQILTGELSELRHAHLKLSEKVQELKLQSGENNDMYIRYEKERDIAQAALAELQNAMKEQAKLYEKVQYESKEKDFLFEKKQKELHEVQTKYNELLNDAADAKENARLANKLKETEKELRNTLAKILKTEEATESAFTCLKCMNIFDKPITCIPCGHSFCEKCVGDFNKKHKANGEKGESCPECSEDDAKKKNGGDKVDYFIQNELLENLSSRFLFRKQAIESLSIMVGNLK